MGMDVPGYLARICAEGLSGPTLATLVALHSAHVRMVPFETYDMHCGIPISLHLSDLYEKIVRRRRGGTCAELNGLFAELLERIGFRLTMHAASNIDEGGVVDGDDFGHLLLVVDVPQGPVVVDVGSGAGWTRPIPLRVGVYEDIKIESVGDMWVSSKRLPDGSWKPFWTWRMEPRSLADFLGSCREVEQDPESFFMQRRVALLAGDNGRISLLNGVFEDPGCEAREVDAGEERALLLARFGIVLDGPWSTI